MKPHTSTRRAFTMIEMLFVLVLLAVFAIVATRITTTLIRLLNTSDTVSEQSAILDDISENLRTDTWSASALASTPATLTLTTPAGTVTYTLANSTLSRTESQATKTWQLPAQSLAFMTASPHVHLATPSTTLTFSSETLRLSLRGAK